jgi:plastocyanin
VRWEFPNQAQLAQAFHTVTFGDADEIPFARADEVPGTFAFDERTFFTTGCGRVGQPVCVISSTDQFVSSGTPIQHMAGVGKIQPFDAVIDLPQGTYNYFCTIHHPAMQGTIEVVADEVAVDNPKPEDFAGEIEALAQKADETFARLSEPTLANEGGRRVWTVHTGARTDDDAPVSFEAFLPSSLNILPGDTVRWVSAGGAAHTVTFPHAGPVHATLNCEFDDPATGAPGVPAIASAGLFGLPWCPPGGRVEAAMTELAANSGRAPGNAVVSPATVHNSGLMIDSRLPERMRGRPRSGVHFPSRFEATFPVPGTYTYRCMIHSEVMIGSITVGGE